VPGGQSQPGAKCRALPRINAAQVAHGAMCSMLAQHVEYGLLVAVGSGAEVRVGHGERVETEVFE
jgi:hypothetical protein